MDSATPALIQTLSNWLSVLQSQGNERGSVFERAFPELHAQVEQFGSLLEELEEKGAEVPDALFQVAANLLTVLDIAWDGAQGESSDEDFAEAYELLECSLMVLSEESAALENVFESIASEQSGVDL
ncbi:MAG: hypothetical protein KIS61_00195 [Candidatus Eremiobacteraeota bacterium]|nr:hypothetical protein [Candidatus Eremiobacteraeota bacterium]